MFNKKSNWYVYAITFIITFGFLSLVVMVFSGVIFPKSKETGGSLQDNSGLTQEEQKQQCLTFLAMVSDSLGNTPFSYNLISYQPGLNELVIVPLPSNLYSVSGTLEEAYNNSGAKGVVSAVESVAQIEISRYIVLDREGLIETVTSLGNINIDINEKIEYSNVDYGVVLNLEKGIHFFTGKLFYEYLIYNVVEKPQDGGYMAAGASMSRLINTNTHSLDVGGLELIYKRLLQLGETDFKDVDFTDRKQSIENTLEATNEPAQHYIPNCEYDGDGKWVLTNNTKLTIQQKVNQEEKALE